MKKTNWSFLIICLLSVITILLITYSKEVIESVAFSISIWKENLFPSLFPFFVVSNLLIEYEFIELLGKYLGGLMPILFGLPKEASFILFISMISGFPSSAKYTSRLVHEGVLSKEEGEQVLTFTHFANPLFILGFIGTSLLHHQKLAFLILFCHISSNLMIGFLSKRKEIKVDKNQNKKNLNQKKNNSSFGSTFSKSVMDSLHTMFLLLGVVTCFLVLTTLLQNLIPMNISTKIALSGLLEMTQGIKIVGELSIPLFLKGLFILSFISFGGFSIHMQVLSFISEENIKYFPYFWGRILQVILACILYLLLFPLVI